MVDRGHKHSDGTYEVGFWAKAVSSNNAIVSKTTANNINHNTSTDPLTSNTDLVGAWIPIAHRDPPLAGLPGTSAASPMISVEAATFLFRGEVDVLRDRINVLSVTSEKLQRMIQTMQEGFTDVTVTVRDSSAKMILDLSQHVAATAQFLDLTL